MGFWNTVRIALRSLGKNRMRAVLTTLGVVIGIAAVTAMVSIGQSAVGIGPRRTRRAWNQRDHRPSQDDAARRCPGLAVGFAHAGRCRGDRKRVPLGGGLQRIGRIRQSSRLWRRELATEGIPGRRPGLPDGAQLADSPRRILWRARNPFG